MTFAHFFLQAKPITHYLELDEELLARNLAGTRAVCVNGMHEREVTRRLPGVQQDRKVAASNLHRSQYNDAAPKDTFEWVAEQASAAPAFGFAKLVCGGDQALLWAT